ncbi:serine/threonine protein phosphatase [Sedimentibacter sp. zth1]|uniref:metallophosphoesterase family protein n=1 Tax=Sedimentibacter sp. zth1 TaxID=2816908 RepID=UPI001A917A5D|nr:metallophosphoesterase family protein [Sedimentibacter sp. zth1]QSX06273.1 serine/threonine protein phosphatase [Sedimentibacter sp. zth1]
MNYKDETIDYIKKVKENLNMGKYLSEKDLEKDFYSINEVSGVKTNSFKYENLNEMFKVQEFLIDEVCKIHEKENDTENERLIKTSLNIKELQEHLNDAKRASNIYSFNKSDYEYYLIGDIHSDTVSFKRILHICKFFENIVDKKRMRLIFLGDYVDRGKAHIKTLEYIMALKYVFPNNVYLLRGNHDDGTIVNEEIKLRVKKRDDEPRDKYFLLYLSNLLDKKECKFHIINQYLKFFNSLCNIAFIDNMNITLMAVHGGIPRPRKDSSMYYNYIKSLYDLTNVEIVDKLNKTIRDNMVWSDPCNEGEDLKDNSGRFKFNVKHFEEFKRRVNFDILIRGHQAIEEGSNNYFNHKLFTVFSSGKIFQNNIDINNETAYKEVTPKIMCFSSEGELSLIETM